MTNPQRLLLALSKKYGKWAFTTGACIEMGRKLYNNNGNRDAWVLAQKGFLTRVKDEDKKRYGHFGKEDLYIITEAGFEEIGRFGQIVLFQ